MTSSASASIPNGQEIINRVLIRVLSGDTSELELENFFWAFGEVVDVRIVCNRKRGFNKSYGFVTFTAIQACDELLKKGSVDYKGEEKLCLRNAVKKVESARATLCKCNTCKQHTYLSKHFAKSPNEKKQGTIKNRFWL